MDAAKCGQPWSKYVIVFKWVFFHPFSTSSSADIMESQPHECYLFSDLSPSMMPISVRFFLTLLSQRHYLTPPGPHQPRCRVRFRQLCFHWWTKNNVVPSICKFFLLLRVAGMSHYTPVFIHVPRRRRWLILQASYTDCLYSLDTRSPWLAILRHRSCTTGWKSCTIPCMNLGLCPYTPRYHVALGLRLLSHWPVL